MSTINTPSASQTKNIGFVVVTIIAIVAMFLITRAVLIKLGVLKSKEQKQREKEVANPNSPFSPLFWQKAPSGSKIITEAVVQKYIYDIYHALGFWHDDFDTIMGTFRKLATKSQVSYMADKFYQRYKVDLLSFLNDGNSTLSLPFDGLTNAHVTQIINYVNNLPKYK